MTSLIRPADIDEFWAETLGQAAKIPLNPSSEPVPHRSTDEVEVFVIGHNSLDGVRVTGHLDVQPMSTFARHLD
jgi:cephalosporin-C deacetylase-like acetyl esterase